MDALHKVIDASQLTQDLEGTLHYDHSVWIELRCVSLHYDHSVWIELRCVSFMSEYHFPEYKHNKRDIKYFDLCVN